MEENYWKAKEEEIKQAEEAVTVGVPPPPQEIKIRTFNSDLESLTKGGGALPRFEEVKILPFEASTKKEEKRRGMLLKGVMGFIAVAILAGISYFFYGIFIQKEPQSPRLPSGSNEPVAQLPRAPDFVHDSLFKVLADETLTLVAKSKAESAAELKTFSQQLIELLATARKTAKSFEVLVQDLDGRYLAAHEVLALGDADVLSPDFILEKFDPDPTFFVYRDSQDNFWPGIVIALKPNENWLFLKDEISGLERSPKIENFFLKFPGPRSGGFADAIVEGQPARKLNFTSGTSFVYGWFRGNLILSASEEGLKEALGRF